MTVRQRLIWLVAASIGPLFLLAGLLLWQSYDRERLSIEHHLRETARALAQMVDLELGRARALLRGLATSDALENANLAAFYVQSRDATADTETWIVLYDRDGRQLMNTRAPFGTMLPQVAAEGLSTIVERRRPAVSNLVYGEVANAYVFSIGVPVIHNNEVAYVLSLNMEARSMARLLQLQGLPADWALIILDRSGITVARSREHDEFVGRPLRADLRIEAEARDAVVHTQTHHGVAVIAAFQESLESGWWAVISAPLEPHMLGIWRSISLSAIAICGVVLLAAVLVVLMARAISEPIEQLGTAAQALGRGQPLGPVPTSLREVSEVGRALAAAADQIRAQSGQREELLRELSAERSRLAAVLENLPVAVIIAEAPSGRVVLGNQHVAGVLGHGFVPPRNVAEYGAYKGYHRDGRPYQSHEWPLARAVTRGETVRNEEATLERSDGRRVVLSMSAAPIREGDRIVAGVVVIDDVSEQRAGEQRQKMLAAEVDHRAKNMLALVQILLRQTRADTPAEYAAAAQGRVAALARAHALLSESRWQGANLRRLIEEELTPFRGRNSDRIRIEGPPMEVTPEAAQSLAMAIHELATNAAKHGALRHPDGHVDVAWTFNPRSRLTLVWTEHGGPPTCAPTHLGLGSAILEQSIRRQLQGEFICEWLQQGLRCTLHIPAAQLQPKALAIG